MAFTVAVLTDNEVVGRQFPTTYNDEAAAIAVANWLHDEFKAADIKKEIGFVVIGPTGSVVWTRSAMREYLNLPAKD